MFDHKFSYNVPELFKTKKKPEDAGACAKCANALYSIDCYVCKKTFKVFPLDWEHKEPCGFKEGLPVGASTGVSKRKEKKDKKKK
jgi:hypothetical protein